MPDAARPTSSHTRLAVVALAVLALIVLAAVLLLRRGDEPAAAPPTGTLAPRGTVPVAPSTTSPSVEPPTTPTAPIPTDPIPTSAPPPGATPSTAEWNFDEAPILTYAQPPVPPDCPTATGTGNATFTWTGDTATPGCLVVRADQPLAVANRSGQEISVSFVSATAVLAPDDERVLGPAGTLADGTGVRYLWVTGHPDAVGIVNIVS